MRPILGCLIYIGIGCAYQSSYDDVSLRQVFGPDVPLSTLGHIFAWPFVMMWHAAGFFAWGIVALIAIVLLSLAYILAKDWWERRGRRAQMRARQVARP